MSFSFCCRRVSRRLLFVTEDRWRVVWRVSTCTLLSGCRLILLLDSIITIIRSKVRCKEVIKAYLYFEEKTFDTNEESDGSVYFFNG